MSSQLQSVDDRANIEDQGMELRRLLLHVAARTLTAKQYQVFVLHFLEGMPQKDIAAEFGLSRSSVCKSAAQVMQRMRLAMGYEFVEAAASEGGSQDKTGDP